MRSEIHRLCNEPERQSDQNGKTAVAGTPLQSARAGPLPQVNIIQTRGHSTCRKPQGKVVGVSGNGLKGDGHKNWRRKTQD
jgi:hypothetical protein